MIQKYQTVLESLKQHTNDYPSGSQTIKRKETRPKEEIKSVHTREGEEQYSR